jgi:hypothetical protein
MKISSERFYRFSLLIPYLAALVLLPFFRLGVAANSLESNALSSYFGFVLVPLFILSIVYIFGLLYWLIPYTVLATLLWLWSRKNDISDIHKIFMWSPVFLAILISIFYALVSYFDLFSDINFLGRQDVISSIAICIFPVTIAFGYFFIGITASIYYYLRKKGIIVDEEVSLNLETGR